MKIIKIAIENYRLLRRIELDLEDELTLIVGKNNTGKTSLLSILNKCFGSNKTLFTFDDFNVDFKKELQDKILTAIDQKIQYEDYINLGIKVKICIRYCSNDNLNILSKCMMDLNPNNNIVVLGYEYILDYSNYEKLSQDFHNKDNLEADFVKFIEDKHKNYFQCDYKTFEYVINTTESEESNSVDLAQINEHSARTLEDIKITDIINFQYISAKRDVTNIELDTTLSRQVAKLYECLNSNDNKTNTIEQFEQKLSDVDGQLTGQYEELFKEVRKSVADFGGLKANESEIKIYSNLRQRKEILKNNTTVKYKDANNHELPEHYNGLGYMNLFSIIFHIHNISHDFNNNKAPINMLFIEEPEAHTHPQMQTVFIKNIKRLLDDRCNNLQYVISTHSAHIVAEADRFESIKYFQKKDYSIIVKNLKDLKKDYGTEDTEIDRYKFLKQYLTLNASELFFADKAIFIEGDTERILLPAMMKKIDIEYQDTEALRSQNISILMVGGSHVKIFDKFIDFLGIKFLIIADIDSRKKCDNGAKCSTNEEDAVVGNSSLKFFLGITSTTTKKQKEDSKLTIDDLKNNVQTYGTTYKKRKKIEDIWQQSEDGNLYISFQTEQDNYLATSFEDAFLGILKNREFVINNKNNCDSLQNKKNIPTDPAELKPYEFSNDNIDKKTAFALDILYYSNDDFNNWDIPQYIKEGLIWLKQD
jgi:putative ATP-dependent endonuclease of OLD family